MKFSVIAVCMSILAADSAAASIVTDYNETEQGDLSNGFHQSGSSDLGQIDTLRFTVTGNLTPGEIDPFDVFAFSVTSAFRINLTSSQHFALDLVRQDDLGTILAFGGPGIDIFAGQGTFGPGAFALSVGPAPGARAGDYSIEILTDATPVPLPAGLPMLLAGLAGLALLRRRSKRV